MWGGDFNASSSLKPGMKERKSILNNTDIKKIFVHTTFNINQLSINTVKNYS